MTCALCATGRIGRITTAGTVTNHYPVPTPASEPSGITPGPGGGFWFTESAANQIGFITSLSGPAGIIGKHMKDSVELALDHLGRKVGGLDTEIIYGDDQRKPDVGKQLADEMLKKHKVNFVSGIICLSCGSPSAGRTTTQASSSWISCSLLIAVSACSTLSAVSGWSKATQTRSAMGTLPPGCVGHGTAARHDRFRPA